MCALELWHRLAALGVAAADRVLMAGFDGDRAGELIGLTSAVFDCRALARTGFELLTRLLQAGRQNRPERILLPVTVRPGRTTQGRS